jgi:isopentenyl-diphosphate delta-isomerase
MHQDLVVLVDADDRETGVTPKLQAHREGALHRAVSVFVLNSKGEMLLQRRAAGKYHSGGLWSNTCCGHPRPGETPAAAAARRLREEMGLSCHLDHVFTFMYRATLDADGLVEHEVDHVFLGIGDDEPRPDPEEVMDWRWAEPEEIERELAENADIFTAWFPTPFRKLTSSTHPAPSPP